MSQLTPPMKVAIISSSIGRADLERAILSVQAQTYPCQHYVFVDGEQFWAEAKAILAKYPQVIVTYLPMNTGANGWSNCSINAIAPFLVKNADILCYLDDDNWYEPNHVEKIVEAFSHSDADYVYAFRNFITPQGQFICRDLFESTGFYTPRLENPCVFDISHNGLTKPIYKQRFKVNHIDTNCYAFKHSLAVEIARSWFSGFHNDYHVYQRIKELNAKGRCSRVFSVNYRFDVEKQYPDFVPSCESYFGCTMELARQMFYQILAAEEQQELAYTNGLLPWEIDQI